MPGLGSREPGRGWTPTRSWPSVTQTVAGQPLMSRPQKWPRRRLEVFAAVERSGIALAALSFPLSDIAGKPDPSGGECLNGRREVWAVDEDQDPLA